MLTKRLRSQPKITAKSLISSLTQLWNSKSQLVGIMASAHDEAQLQQGLLR